MTDPYDNDASWQMNASAEDEGRVYQAGGDQHITEYHYHGAEPVLADDEVDDEDEDDDEGGWHYEPADVYFLNGLGDLFALALLPLAPIIPLAISGASVRATWTADPGPSLWWSTLYTLGTMALAALVFRILRMVLPHRTDVYSWWYLPLGVAVFAYYGVRAPEKATFEVIADLGQQMAQVLGPL
ncbi:hypothetical protein OEIGOIKO_03557 [Streptomyces chrestomyceticus JCM 4735]|uniref:Uncharacterized protein n=1 Tax=Streptomyces chrestomyceticus JCM 4735 TaxID=1306181 RepID=A0A7U9PYJ7_9ACTN|nr:hypothetical protein [Streptomyces chrestomyceticus]GCD35810.1 hypothetical protein OEIGOIKO_03557 [Streptomyces chrestomyceticus JCM 4735]